MIPRVLVLFAFSLVVLLTSHAVVASDRDDAEAIQDKRVQEILAQAAIPRIPTRDSLLKGTDGKDETEVTKSGDWVAEFIAKKKSKADAEVDELRKKVQEEDATRVAKEKERQRRLSKVSNYDDLVPVRRESKPVAIHVKLDFQVPEIETCRRAAEVCKQRKALADDIIDLLSQLDRNNDGRLSTDEYVDACAIVISSAKLFQQVDANDDGQLSEAEIENAKLLPKDAAEARVQGHAAALVPNTHVKAYDVNNDSILEAEERKTLSMAYVEISIRAQKEADFYRRLADSLTVSREIVAIRFADMVIAP
jgi:hypothetical protein